MSNADRFVRIGDVIVDKGNGWRVVGKWYDIPAEVLRLREENERLRALLPDAETLDMLQYWLNDYYVPEKIQEWLKGLDKLEAEAGSDTA